MTMPTAITITRMHCFSLHSPNHLSLPPLSLALPPSTRTRFFKGSSILTRSFNADASFGTDSRLQGEGNNGFGNLPKSGGTRLSRVLQTQQKQLRLKFDEVRRNLPLKVFLVLLGFYSANALATILGQTGDWDVLVAGIAVAIIEILGSLLYRKPSVSSRFQNLLRLVNYWKAGFTLGLFVDAFKVGS